MSGLVAQVMPKVRKMQTWLDSETQKKMQYNNRDTDAHHSPCNNLQTRHTYSNHKHTQSHTHNASIASFQSAALQCWGRMLHSEMQIMSRSLCRGQNHRASRAGLCWRTHTHTHTGYNNPSSPSKLLNSMLCFCSSTQDTHKPNRKPTLPPTSVPEHTALRCMQRHPNAPVLTVPLALAAAEPAVYLLPQYALG